MASDLDYNPLNETHLKRINDALGQIEIAKARLRLATAAGLDVSKEKTEVERTENQLRSIKQVYFPGR